jgi:hypothetical protein
MRLWLLPALVTLLPGSIFASIDPALLALVPPDSRLITGVDADRARSSTFGQYMLNRVRTDDPHFEQFVNDTGFDPRRDLQSFVFATNGGKGEGHFAVLARGIFDPDRLKAAAKAHGSRVQSYNGADLFVSSKGQSTAGFAFLDSTTVALADTVTLKQILDSRNSPTALDPALLKQLESANATNDVWFVSSLPGSFLASNLHRQMGEEPDNSGAFRGVVQSRGGIRFGDIVHLSFDALTRSPQDATSLTDVLRFLASLTQMERNNDPRAAILANSLDTMQLTSNGSTVHAALALTESNLERLVDLGPRPRQTAQSRPK